MEVMARKNEHAAASRRKFLTGIAMTGAASAVSATGTRSCLTDILHLDGRVLVKFEPRESR